MRYKININLESELRIYILGSKYGSNGNYDGNYDENGFRCLILKTKQKEHFTLLY